MPEIEAQHRYGEQEMFSATRLSPLMMAIYLKFLITRCFGHTVKSGISAGVLITLIACYAME